VDFDRKLPGLFPEKKPSQMIVVRIKLPIQKAISRSNVERITDDRRSTMRGWAQPYNLGTDGDSLVITVFSTVIEGNQYAHPTSRRSRFERFRFFTS